MNMFNWFTAFLKTAIMTLVTTAIIIFFVSQVKAVTVDWFTLTNNVKGAETFSNTCYGLVTVTSSPYGADVGLYAFFDKAVMYSANGITWVKRGGLPTWANPDPLTGYTVTWLVDRFILIGGGYGVHTSDKIWISLNGTSWTDTGLVIPKPVQYHMTNIFGSNLVITGGLDQDAGGLTNCVQYCSVSDYSTWTIVPFTGSEFTPRDSHSTAVYDGKLFVVGGDTWADAQAGCGTYKNDVYYTSDLISWTKATNNASFPCSGYSSMITTNIGLYKIGGGVYPRNTFYKLFTPAFWLADKNLTDSILDNQSTLWNDKIIVVGINSSGGVSAFWGGFLPSVYTATVTKTITPTRTNTPVITRTATLTITQTRTPTKTITQTSTRTPSLTVTPTITPIGTATVTATKTGTKTTTPTITLTKTVTPFYTPTVTPTVTPLATIWLRYVSTDTDGHLDSIKVEWDARDTTSTVYYLYISGFAKVMTVTDNESQVNGKYTFTINNLIFERIYPLWVSATANNWSSVIGSNVISVSPKASPTP